MKRSRNLPEPVHKEMPVSPSFVSMLGPSIILLGLSLGSGEAVLWPYLVSNFGLGIIWAALIGITFQYFLNMEVERYALVRGESVFVGLARLYRSLPYWFILTTFLGFGWPGIVASSAKVLSMALGIERFDVVAMAMLLLIGTILSLGPVLYKTVETYQKVAIGLGIPLIVIIIFLVAEPSSWHALANGVAGRGEGYFGIPKGIPLFTFLGALAYAGAGGNLNLGQSLYVKEKGYGMGAFGTKITSVISGKAEGVSLTGATFLPTEENMARFTVWWKKVNLEHLLLFWLLGFLSIAIMATLAYATAYGAAGNASGIAFVANEGRMIAQRVAPAVGTLFLLIVSLLLFGSQFSVLDSTSRIMTENVAILRYTPRILRKIPALYYGILWTQILFGILIFLVGFSEPRRLVTIGAVVNACATFAGFILVWRLNRSTLPEPLQASPLRRSVLLVAILFFGFFTSYAFLNALGIVR